MQQKGNIFTETFYSKMCKRNPCQSMAAPESGWPWAPKLSSSGSQQKPEEKAGIYQSALEKKEYDGEKKEKN